MSYIFMLRIVSCHVTIFPPLSDLLISFQWGNIQRPVLGLAVHSVQATPEASLCCLLQPMDCVSPSTTYLSVLFGAFGYLEVLFVAFLYFLAF